MPIQKKEDDTLRIPDLKVIQAEPEFEKLYRRFQATIQQEEASIARGDRDILRRLIREGSDFVVSYSRYGHLRQSPEEVAVVASVAGIVLEAARCVGDMRFTDEFESACEILGHQKENRQTQPDYLHLI